MKIVVTRGTGLISTRVGAQAARGRPRSRSVALGPAAEVKAGVKHHVAQSIVGTERPTGNAYGFEHVLTAEVAVPRGEGS
jgi:hypothetical protein